MAQTLYHRIYAIVRQVPPGQVTTYGRVAGIAGGCSAQMVGFAMSALPEGSDVPWHRVINAQGKISPHGAGFGTAIQEQKLRAEGLVFDQGGRIDLDIFGWPGLLT